MKCKNSQTEVIDGVEFRLGIGFDLWDIDKGKPSEMVDMDHEELLDLQTSGKCHSLTSSGRSWKLFAFAFKGH